MKICIGNAECRRLEVLRLEVEVKKDDSFSRKKFDLSGGINRKNYSSGNVNVEATS